MKRIDYILALIIIFLIAVSANAQTKLWSSNFEGLTIGGQVSDYRYITGTDTETGDSWPPTFWGSSNNGIHTISVAKGATYTNELQTITGWDDDATNTALYSAITGFPSPYANTQTPYQINKIGGDAGGFTGNGVLNEPDTIYQKMYVRFDDLSEIIAAPSFNKSRMFWQYKSVNFDDGWTIGDGDDDGYRISVYVYCPIGGTVNDLYWKTVADYQPSNNIWWEDTNTTVSVPVEDWFLLEIYWVGTDELQTPGDPTAGLFWIKVNGQEIAYNEGKTLGDNNPITFQGSLAAPDVKAPDNLNYWTLWQNYSAYTGGHWIDDIEIWDGLPATTISVTGVTTYPTTDKLLVAGTRQLYEFVAPTNADDLTGTWSSNDAGVATVSSGGLVTGVGVGTCTITFTTTDGSFTDTTSITVESSSTEDSIMVLKPQGYYTPTSGDADSWDDTSGFELHGTEVGTITFTDQATFDGASYYDLPDSQFLDYVGLTDEYTLIYREGDTAPTSGAYVIGKGTDVDLQYCFPKYLSGNMNLQYFGTWSSESLSHVPVANNRLIIAVVTTTQVDVWVDGVHEVIASATVGSMTSNTSVNIGGVNDGDLFINNGATLDIVATIPKAINTSEREAIESEFQVNGAVASNSTKPASALDKPVFYSGTTKKLFPQN